MWFTEILIFILTAIIVAIIWKWWRFIYLANKIPKSTFDNSIRNMLDLLINGDPKRFYNEINKLTDMSGLSRTWFGHELMVNITTPEDCKIIFNSKECIDKPYFVKEYPKIIQGTLFGHLEPWQAHRKVLNPYFGVQSLRSIIPIFNKKVHIMMKNFEKMEGKGEFNVFYNMTALTLETILSVMEFDVDIQNQEEESRDVFIHNLEVYTEIVTMRILKLWLRLDFIFNRSKYGKMQQEAINNCAMTFTPEIIKQIRQKLNGKSSLEFDEKPKNFIRALLDPRCNFTEAEISDEIRSLTIAAQDTSAIATSSTLILLGMHKDIQDKVVNELRQVLGSSTDYLDIEQLNKLEYLEMVINEAMRLIPVVPIVFRTNENEITSHEGFIIPAKSFFFIPIFKIHRSKDFWGDDADKFKPERFSKENIQNVHPYAFIPFAKGPRMCIGWRYAMFLMKIQLANILMKYEVDTSLKFDELEFKVSITLNVCQGFNISIKEREN